MKPKRVCLFFVLTLSLAACLLLTGCFEQAKPDEQELAAFSEIAGRHYTAADLTILTDEVAAGDRKEKFKAIRKVFLTPQGDYAFISHPVGYNGPIELAVIVDRKTGTTRGMRIVRHVETEHYVRDMNKDWFTKRFDDKTVDSYLRPVHLEARQDNEIVVITGATVSTEAIVNGVNACLGAFREFELKRPAAAVPYMVRFKKDKADGPKETGTVAIRAHGVVLGEVSLKEIKAMKSAKRTISIHSTSGTSRHSFRGCLLSDVIRAVEPALLDQYGVVQAVGVDDYISHIAMEEVLGENNVYLMYEDNDEPLPMKNGKPGAMRIVVLDDLFGQRFTNHLIEIVLE